MIKDSNKMNNHMLIIISDHGMTESGNHGGASKIEYESAMFAYTKGGFNKNINLWSAWD